MHLISPFTLYNFDFIQEIAGLPNVFLIDPIGLISTDLQSFENRRAMYDQNLDGYLKSIRRELKNTDYQSLFIADPLTAGALMAQFPDVDTKLSVYVTSSSMIDAKENGKYRNLDLLCQSQFRIIGRSQEVIENLKRVAAMPVEKSFKVLPFPILADSQLKTDTPTLPAHTGQIRLIYTGDLGSNSNFSKILSTYKSVKRNFSPSLTFEIVGDSFDRTSLQDIKNTIYLLDSSRGLKWHRSLSPIQMRQLIQRSDVAICWNSDISENAEEIFLKIAEYGSFGVPTIVLRNIRIEEILGHDYPLFANSITDLKELFQNLTSMHLEIQEAAARCYEFSMQFWDSSLLPEFLEVLGIGSCNSEELRISLENGKDALNDSQNEIANNIQIWRAFLDRYDRALVMENHVDGPPKIEELSVLEKLTKAEQLLVEKDLEIEKLKAKVEKFRKLMARLEKTPIRVPVAMIKAYVNRRVS
ncbi:glycosyltransferase [Corynebacterium glutamicum]|uniref:glycosyltransferase n=1 Tax=Corynebacterium glutamicum TaxID=1718 RepID=UPI0011984F03|nr:glycosyltransferase [Corynebacterium glutamicum]QDX74611.1 hypothetical protein AKL15_01990 [Corynebacterium glutamicum]TWS38055.1 hypothetical protein AKJ20_00355 [Corynebacterium glutamicum]TWS44889.1 hypothetical protein AKJ24_02400 [Corynebacterium glutamicum]TWS49164.1 hypothetical protein AKJ25_09375 [Corynebacterium glutamicum]